MAYLISMIDGDLAPRQGETGVVTFLRQSETGFRAQATAVGQRGPTRKLGAWMGSCPVAVSQALFQWLSSAGWPGQVIQTAPNSPYRPDQIIYGPQPLQEMNWSADHSQTLALMLSGLQQAPQPQQQAPQPQTQQQPQQQPQTQQQAPQTQQQMRITPVKVPASQALRPPAPQAPAPQSQSLRLAHPSELGEDEQHLVRLLSGAAKKLRTGSSAADIAEVLADHLADFDLDDDDDGDVAPQAPQQPPQPQYRPLQPGEIPPGVTPEQAAQLHAYSDPAAEEKMRRTLARSQQAIERARAHAATMAAHQPQQPPAPVEAPAEPDDELDDDLMDDVETVEFEGAEYLTVDSMADACDVHPGTVRKWIKKGRIEARQARLPGDRVDRWLISVDVLNQMEEAQ